MSITRRLLDLARSNLNALIDREAAPDLDHYTDDELAAELELRKDRKRRHDAARAAREAAEQAARERARTQAAYSGASSSTQSGTAGADARDPGRARPAAPPTERNRIAALYAQLESPAGSNLETVKRNFRRLMRQHHPDLNGGSPEKLKQATERTMRITAAYQELEGILVRGR